MGMKPLNLLLWKAYTTGIMVGALAATGIYSLIQDWMGPEGYVEYVQNHWVSASWTVPIALASLLIGLIVTIGMCSSSASDILIRRYRAVLEPLMKEAPLDDDEER